MTDTFNIREVISRSTSDVAISELAKQGFQKVKVLHKDTVDSLVREAVDRVVQKQLAKLSEEDRERIYAESKAEFDQLARQHQDRENELESLRAQVAALQAEEQQLRVRLAEREAELSAVERGGADRDELSSLKSSIEALATQLARGGGGGAGGNVDVDPGAAIESLFTRLGEMEVDSNLDKVKSKKAKAAGVANSLSKLKSLQNGGSE